MHRAIVAAVLLILAVANAPAQQTFHVPAQVTSIQQGVVEASAGDVIVVAAGVYTETVVVDKPVTIVSADGPGVTHIVGAMSGSPVVTLDAAGLFPGPLLAGFTVRAGDSSGLAVHGPAIVRECVIRDNAGPVGGVECLTANGPVLLEDCSVRENVGAPGADSDVTGGCAAAGRGGAGGLSCSGGGGVLLVNCEIGDNTGGDGGGVLSPCAGAPGVPGAGGLLTAGPVVLVNCTVSGNVGGLEAGGGPLRIGGVDHVGPGPILINTIVQANTGVSFHFSGSVPSSAPVVSHSNVEGYVGGLGNMDADPVFADPLIGDYRLMPTSPCIDAGTALPPVLPVEDFEGNPRVVGAAPDMGCDEYVPELTGSADAVDLLTRINGFGGHLDAKVGYGGADLTAEIVASTGPYYGAVPILVAQAFSNGFVPQGFPQAHLRVDLDDLVVLYDGRFDPGPSLGLGPVSWGPVQIPHGLDTVTLRLQGIALTPLALNGTYAVTRARDIYFRF